MKVVTLRAFRDRATEMMRSEDVLLITRDGRPAGFFLPWAQEDVPLQVRKDIYKALSEGIRQEMESKAISEDEILADFKTARRTRR